MISKNDYDMFTNANYSSSHVDTMNLIEEKTVEKVKLRKINRTRFFEQVVDQIRVLIESGEVLVGERLPTESELSEQLNIGRSSIREALRVLETEGLIEVRQGAGTFVMPRSEWNSSRNEAVGWLKQRGESLIQLLQVREWLEGLSVSLVAVNPSAELIDKLENILKEMAFLVKDARQNNMEVDLNQIAALNTSFHLTISSYSGNLIAHELLSHILPAFSESNKAVIYTNPELDLQAAEHSHVLEAIKDCDPERAETTLRRHIARVRDEIRNIRIEP